MSNWISTCNQNVKTYISCWGKLGHSEWRDCKNGICEYDNTNLENSTPGKEIKASLTLLPLKCNNVTENDIMNYICVWLSQGMVKTLFIAQFASMNSHVEILGKSTANTSSKQNAELTKLIFSMGYTNPPIN